MNKNNYHDWRIQLLKLLIKVIFTFFFKKYLVSGHYSLVIAEHLN